MKARLDLGRSMFRLKSVRNRPRGFLIIALAKSSERFQVSGEERASAELQPLDPARHADGTGNAAASLPPSPSVTLRF